MHEWVCTVPDVAQSQLLDYVGALMRLNFMKVHWAYHAVLLKHGIDQATLDEWSRKADDGLFVFFSPKILFSTERANERVL